MTDDYSVPEELAKLWDSYEGALECRDKAILEQKKVDVDTAIKFAAEAVIFRNEFWSSVRSLYLEILPEKQLSYNHDKRAISIIGQEKSP
jgi:hypothetical protein